MRERPASIRTFQVTPPQWREHLPRETVDLTIGAFRVRASRSRIRRSRITWQPQKPKDGIVFSGITLGEVYDQYGNIVKRGYANKLDVSTLKKDMYYLELRQQDGGPSSSVGRGMRPLMAQMTQLFSTESLR